ncbi:hypothetical protein [Neobacillus vireti]|uniref:hypothetical protein n=1 Tax=Neobacillus vireti TaxID=220686 RepID=UPI003000817E
MKKFIWTCVLGLALLTGCQNTEPKIKDEGKQSTQQNQQKAAANTDSPFPYPTLLSESAQTFSLLVIGDQDTHIEDNEKVTEKVNDILSLPELGMVQKAYPALNIKSEPAYILFDQTGVVHQSKKLEELTSFLDKNSPK